MKAIEPTSGAMAPMAANVTIAMPVTSPSQTSVTLTALATTTSQSAATAASNGRLPKSGELMPRYAATDALKVWSATLAPTPSSRMSSRTPVAAKRQAPTTSAGRMWMGLTRMAEAAAAKMASPPSVLMGKVCCGTMGLGIATRPSRRVAPRTARVDIAADTAAARKARPDVTVKPCGRLRFRCYDEVTPTTLQECLRREATPGEHRSEVKLGVVEDRAVVQRLV